MDKYNKYFITDKLQITATTDNCNDKNDDNLHSNHDFAPYSIEYVDGAFYFLLVVIVLPISY